MIATLTGKISDKLLDKVVIEAGGVGYGVFVISEDYNSLILGEAHRLYVYEHIREQSHDLFGFMSRSTQELFEKLLSVNGVGPKMALNTLSIGTANELKQAIADGNVKYITQASGVGKRVAERLVVDLKDKVGLNGVDLESTDLLRSSNYNQGDEAVQALIALGFTPQDAQAVLKDIDETLSSEERVKQALKRG